MKTVISYSRPDRDAAATLAQILTEMGVEVWWDQQLTAGQTFNQVIDTQIRSADAVIVLWSPDSIDSKWVTNEATLALDLGKLYPIRIKQCSPRVPFYGIHTPDILWNDELRRFTGTQALFASLRLGTRAQQAGSVFGFSQRDLSATPAKTLLVQVLRRLTLDQIYQFASSSAEAAWLYGTASMEGVGTEKNDSIAASYFEAAASAGFLRGNNSLSALLFNRKTEHDAKQAINHTLYAASKGLAIAQFRLGDMTSKGYYVPKDLFKAYHLFHSAALGGSVDAMAALAWCYYNGEGTTKDRQESHHWFKVAADNGHARAMCMLGALATDGNLQGAGYREAAISFQAAFAAGDDAAAGYLGDLHADQKHADRYDPGLAIHWYTTHGSIGNSAGYYSAATFIISAGGKLDHLGSVRWLLAKAADMGDMRALLDLAGLMEDGRYGPKDLKTALEWYAEVANSPASDQQRKYLASQGIARLTNNC